MTVVFAGLGILFFAFGLVVQFAFVGGRIVGWATRVSHDREAAGRRPAVAATAVGRTTAPAQPSPAVQPLAR